jgi:hypothetical protein
LFAESRTPGSRQTCVVGWYITTIHATKGWEQEVGPHRGATSVQWSQRRSQSRCQCSHWGSYVSSCLLPNLSQGSKCVVVSLHSAHQRRAASQICPWYHRLLFLERSIQEWFFYMSVNKDQ